MVFLRKLARGGSEHSFGIHVAKLAGMPRSIVDRAAEVLGQLEAANRHSPAGGATSAAAKAPAGKGRKGCRSVSMPEIDASSGMQLSFFQLDDPILSQIRDEILNLDINNLSPLQALNKLSDIRSILTGK